MDLKISYISNKPDTDIRSLALEMPDGTDAILIWGSCISVPEGIAPKPGTYKKTLVCHNLAYRDRAMSDFSELCKAKILDAEYSPPGDISDRYLSVFRAWAVDAQRNIQVPLDSYSGTFPPHVPYKSVKRGARHMVRYFNENGLPTEASDPGYPDGHAKSFWVDFRADVTDGDISRFMDAHMQAGAGFMSRGMFCSRYDKFDAGGGIVKTIRYVADDMLDAAMDLADWKTDDMTGVPGHGSTAVTWNAERDAASAVVTSMDPRTADALYKAVRTDRVAQDIRAWLKDNPMEFSEDQINFAAELFARHGKYDCNLSYWENIRNVVETARG